VPNGQLAARLTSDGADPTQSPVNFGPPSGKVLDLMLHDWKQTLRKPADVLVVVEGTAGRHSLEQTALCQALGSFGQRDRLTFTLFPSGSGSSLEPTPIDTSASSCGGVDADLRKALAAKPPSSNQLLDDVVLAAVRSLQTSGDSKSFKAVLIVDLDGGTGLPADDTLSANCAPSYYRVPAIRFAFSQSGRLAAGYRPSPLLARAWFTVQPA
jgi:hypothetical protein